MIRIAAVGDVHLGEESAGTYRPRLAGLAERADILLLAGDLTRRGTTAEAKVVGAEFSALPIPTFAVLGNHDFESDAANALVNELECAGVTVLEGTSARCVVDGCSIGIAGVKGFGGGFAGRCGSDFGEPEMKAFIRHTQDSAHRLKRALGEVSDATLRIALLHYAPIEATLEGEDLAIYPFLGSYLLAEAADSGRASVVVHGHAHAGALNGETPGGVPVRNVALPAIRQSYRLFCLDSSRLDEAVDSPRSDLPELLR